MKCPNCGANSAQQDGVCPYCGTVLTPPSPAPVQAPPAAQPQVVVVRQPVYVQQPVYVPAAPPAPAVSAKNKWVAFALAFFLGYFGIHYFYVGRIGMGILYFFTGGLFGIGWLVDIIRTACGSFTDSRGPPLRR